MILSYQQCIELYGNDYEIKKLLKEKKLFKIEKGLYSDYDENKLFDVIKDAQLDVLIDSLSNGVDTIIGESATNVSGGEKQRIAIARALIKEASIIIIDEGTANLNKDMARCIEDIFLNNSNLMVIMVTHHFDENILRKYDEILYMSNGKIKSVNMEDII